MPHAKTSHAQSSSAHPPHDNDIHAATEAVREDMEQIAHEAGRYVRNLANSSEDTLVEKIREKPVASMLIAAGVGFVLGALLTRR